MKPQLHGCRPVHGPKKRATNFRPTNLCVLMLLFAMACAATGARATPTTAKKTVEPTDAEITRAVEREIDHDRAVPLDKVLVSTSDGVVTLNGTVDNLMAKERALRLAETVRGVRTVIDRVQTRPTVHLSDAELKHDIGDALFYDAATDSYEIEVDVDAGVATLSGVVDSFAERQLAERVAKTVNGVRAVNNHTTVKPASDRPAREIRADIEKRLRWDALVNEQDIKVEVHDGGKVVLSGTVGSASEKRRTEIDAWVAGVRSVDGEGLQVAAQARNPKKKVRHTPATDDEIEAAINAALALDPRAVGASIEPEALAGVVVLRGVTQSIQARDAAAQIARSTTGVSSVTNRIRVQPVQMANRRLQNRVIRALARNPYLDSFNLTVQAVGGVVFLGGTVDSYFEKVEAERVASKAASVARVDNDIQVARGDAPLVYDPYVTDVYPYDYEWYDYQPRRSRLSDRTIEEAIEREMWWSPFVDGFQVNVDVENGVATLEGKVDTYRELNAAVESAYEGGANWVDNELDVVGSKKRGK